MMLKGGKQFERITVYKKPYHFHQIKIQTQPYPNPVTRDIPFVDGINPAPPDIYKTL